MRAIERDKRILREMLEKDVPPGRGWATDERKARGAVRRFLAVPRALSAKECERLIKEWVYGGR